MPGDVCLETLAGKALGVVGLVPGSIWQAFFGSEIWKS